MFISSLRLGALRMHAREAGFLPYGEASLLSIPIDRGRRALAIVRPLGGKRVACLVFGPTVDMNPGDVLPVGWRPLVVRKAIIEDLGIRDGSWAPVRLPDVRPEVDAMFAAAEPLLRMLEDPAALVLVPIDETTHHRIDERSSHAPLVFTSADVEGFERAFAVMFGAATPALQATAHTARRASRLLAAALRTTDAEAPTLLVHATRIPEICAAYAVVDQLENFGYTVSFDLLGNSAMVYVLVHETPNYENLRATIERISAIVEEFDGTFEFTRALGPNEPAPV